VGIKSGKNGMMEWWKEQSFCFHCSQPIIPVFHYSTIPDLAEDLTNPLGNRISRAMGLCNYRGMNFPGSCTEEKKINPQRREKKWWARP